eukprot:CAMPEP_0177293838 /NCGR_PEP_ID=MMETSP0368-20130122/983_1 /TAXON_ID=447022 ORGANISM="Scrippsiella hangoei-like, Strain SHHI-4" /NCGR_SAMPLE_ID=MMETSP0368 /ASSEMBLY_ACC=CAM_ASM_000363 /LENGTH=645 /DNA_ID=CAMNT_0018751685 /DNA_START=1 /DNA_END=1935 /DNA_ORIENTATION=-
MPGSLNSPASPMPPNTSVGRPSNLVSEGTRVESSHKKIHSRKTLQHIIERSTGENANMPIPVALLEAAFQEIDDDYSGLVSLEELAESLRDCGLNPSDNAMKRIVEEIDQDNSGQIDVTEFVGFFKMTQELYEFEGKMAGRATLFHAVLQCGFFSNLIVLALVVTLQSRTTDQSSDSYSQLQSLSQMLMITFVILFVCVIVSPVVRMTLGPSLAAWLDIVVFTVKGWIRRWKDRRAEAERQKKEIDDLFKKAAEFEAEETSKSGGSPCASPRSRNSRRISEAGSQAWSGSPSSGKIGALALRGPSSTGTSFSMEGDESEKELGEQPGVYLILHDGAAVRSGISSTSTKLSALKRGEKVRIVEIFEYARQHRVRGRLQSAIGKNERHWISLRDTSDEYCWARRDPLQEESEWAKKAKLKRQNSSSSRMSTRRSSDQLGMPVPPRATISEDDVNQAPAYDVGLYDDAEKRLWTECYSDAYVKMFCMRSKWSTKDKLVVEVFAERVQDALYVEDENEPGSRVKTLKLELPREVGAQALMSGVPQFELKDEGLVSLCPDELRGGSSQVCLWVWPHPTVDQKFLTPLSNALAGCCVKYELLLPGKMEEDIYVRLRLSWDQWATMKCFNGTMQVLDVGRHRSSNDELPGEK